MWEIWCWDTDFGNHFARRCMKSGVGILISGVISFADVGNLVLGYWFRESFRSQIWKLLGHNTDLGSHFALRSGRPHSAWDRLRPPQTTLDSLAQANNHAYALYTHIFLITFHSMITPMKIIKKTQNIMSLNWKILTFSPKTANHYPFWNFIFLPFKTAHPLP